MVVGQLDPSALQLMRLSSELMRSQDQVRRLRKRVWALATALHAERAASTALLDLCDTLLGDLDNG